MTGAGTHAKDAAIKDRVPVLQAWIDRFGACPRAANARQRNVLIREGATKPAGLPAAHSMHAIAVVRSDMRFGREIKIQSNRYNSDKWRTDDPGFAIIEPGSESSAKVIDVQATKPSRNHIMACQSSG
ncbi:hypothetical protein OEW28_08680 [Defluviimonas sp. WL0002]|uniref:Uncharacterized protein n=1 Tax=Albidovulum marisflavi TaxID=2984159 RepID=A0ABT2ZCF6_9RHOB|nr:hypothetical protein [Defluviimonas sp. WL0002]MCV2868702.1 hypothetical protein [Defluviimonas sp. WL0002]